MTTKAKCICQADPKCQWCRGKGELTLNVAHDPWPFCARGWNAFVEGREEDAMGWGETRTEAVQDLMARLEEASAAKEWKGQVER